MKDRKKDSKELIDDYDYLTNAASAMDFTGLMPSLPQNDAEIESYNDIFQFLPPVKNTHESSKSRPEHRK